MKRRLVLFLVCLLCLSLRFLPAASGAPSAPSAPMPAPDGQRFLFIADTSSGMERLKAESETTLYDLMVSGLFGQMQTGDTYAMWMFDKETHAGKFPMQVWEPRRGSQLATIAAAYLSNQKYENAADVKRMTELLMTVVHAVSNLNVFIISDGSTSMRGTPFDKAINAEYKKKRRERSSAKRPFVTTLVVRDGSITNYSVVVAGQPIPLPERPPPAAAITAKVAPPPNRPAGVLVSNTLVTSAAATVSFVPIAQGQSPAASAPTSVASAVPSSNVVVKAEIAAPRVIQIVTRSNSVSAATEPGPPELGKTNVTLAFDVAPTNNPAPELSAPAPTPPAPPSAAPPPVAESAAPRAALAAILSAPVTVAARELHPEPATANPAPPAAVQAAALPVPSGPGAGLFLTLGSLLMAAAFLLLFVVLCRLRPAPGASLITQSMERR